MVSLLILVWKFFLTRKFDRQKRAKVSVKHEILRLSSLYPPLFSKFVKMAPSLSEILT